MQKFYRLKDNYILRGWEKLPYAAVDTQTLMPDFMDSRHFNVLKLCNGNIDTSLPFITDSDREIIREFEEKGIIEPCTLGQALSDNQQYRKFPARYVRHIHWSITGRCNYKCKHCYLSAPDAKYGELSHEQMMNVISQLEDCGIMSVSLTGGEPLIRDDFLEIVDALVERGIIITQIYSNGALVNEKLLRELDSRGIHPEFNMSFDGVGCHDWLRGVPGAEDMVNNAFALCRDMGFPTGAEMCLHRMNMHTVRDSVNHLASLGVKALKLGSVKDTEAWEEYKADNTLTLKEAWQVYLDYIPDYYADGMPLSIQMANVFMANPNKPDVFSIPEYCQNVDQDACICGAARNAVYISPEGRLLPCMPMAGTSFHDRMPLLTENSLAECINSSFWFELVNMRIRDFFAVNEDCRNCRQFRHCGGGCRAEALTSDPNNYMGKSPGLCELLLGGWPEKIISLMKTIKPEAECINFEEA